MILKKIAICLMGIVLGIFLFSLFVFINVNFTEAIEFARPDYMETAMNDPQENPFERLGKTLWRFDYLFFPLTIAGISLAISFVDRSKYKFLLVSIGILPFIIFYLVAGSFSIGSFLFAIGYITIALVVSFVIPMKKQIVEVYE